MGRSLACHRCDPSGYLVSTCDRVVVNGVLRVFRILHYERPPNTNICISDNVFINFCFVFNRSEIIVYTLYSSWNWIYNTVFVFLQLIYWLLFRVSVSDEIMLFCEFDNSEVYLITLLKIYNMLFCEQNVVIL